MDKAPLSGIARKIQVLRRVEEGPDRFCQRQFQ